LIEEQAARIRLILFDVDGVLTDGTLLLHADGTESKVFDIKDGTGIVWAQRLGLTVGFLSARSSAATAQRAAQLGITLVHQGVASKLDTYEQIADSLMLEDDEIALLAATGTGVAHCPRSNAALGCGVAPLAELRAAGANVGVGTDSPASAPSFDFFEELRSVVLSARARAARPDVLTPAEALELGTLGSARALGLDSETGSLVPGKRADLAVVSLEDSSYLPWEDPAGAVVFGGSPDRVLATYVDGEVRYEKGGMNWHELTAAARSARRAMLAQPAASPLAAPHA